MTNIVITSEYAKYLNTIDWDFFATFTTKYELTLPSARRTMERLYTRAKENFGGIRLFWVAEPFDCKEGFHTHALVKFHQSIWKEQKVDFDLLRQAWKIVSKGGVGKESNFTVLKRYDAKKGASGYVGKYLMKQNADYDLLF